MKLWRQTVISRHRAPFLDKESQPARQGWPFGSKPLLSF